MTILALFVLGLLLGPCVLAQQPSVAQWLDAAVKGDVARLSKYLDGEPSLLDAADERTGRTALIEAAWNNQVGVAEKLIALGANVDLSEHSGGLTAFDAACHIGSFPIVKLLIDKVDVNLETPKDGNRAIHRVAAGTHRGYVDILKLLLESGKVSPNDKSRESFDAIGAALRITRPNQFRKGEKQTPTVLGIKREIVRLLLEHGADANELTDDDITLLGLSFREVEDAKNRPIKERKVPHFRDHMTADERMLEAVQRGDWAWVELEIRENGANVNAAQKSSKQTALMTACLKGDVHTLKKLIQLGANASIGEQQGYTPFHGAGFQGHAQIAKVLMEELNLDPNDMHKDGYQPIHRACWGKQERHSEFVRYLLSTGKVDPDSKTANGLTPLQVLASHELYRNPKTAKVLANFGADVSVLKDEEIEALGLSSYDDFQTCPRSALSRSP